METNSEINPEVILNETTNEKAVTEVVFIVELLKKKVVTEDLGKIFEMGICLLYEIEYDGKYKYSLEEANSITPFYISNADFLYGILL